MCNILFSMSATNSVLLECIELMSMPKINVSMHAVNLCSSSTSGLTTCVWCRFPVCALEAQPSWSVKPLHQYRMIVLHIYNVSDVCGIIQDLLLKGVRQWGMTVRESCGYFLISLKLVYSQPKEQSW